VNTRQLLGRSTPWRKGRATTTSCFGIRVANYKLCALQAFSIINFCTHQILETHRVYQQGNAAILYRGVAILKAFIKSESILESRAPTPTYKHPKLQVDIGFFFNELPHLICSGISEYQRCRRCRRWWKVGLMLRGWPSH